MAGNRPRERNREFPKDNGASSLTESLCPASRRMRVQVPPGPPKLKGGYMFSLLKKGWLWLLAMVLYCIPSSAFAGSSVNASQFLIPLLTIVVISVLAGFALWAIRYWTTELNSIAPILVKILTFIVIAIACIWIILIIAGLLGVHIV
jgi:hypothetical protein